MKTKNRKSEFLDRLQRKRVMHSKHRRMRSDRKLIWTNYDSN